MRGFIRCSDQSHKAHGQRMLIEFANIHRINLIVFHIKKNQIIFQQIRN